MNKSAIKIRNHGVFRPIFIARITTSISATAQWYTWWGQFRTFTLYTIKRKTLTGDRTTQHFKINLVTRNNKPGPEHKHVKLAD